MGRPAKRGAVNIYFTCREEDDVRREMERELHEASTGGSSASNHALGTLDARLQCVFAGQDRIPYSIANVAGNLLFDLASTSGRSYKSL